MAIQPPQQPGAQRAVPQQPQPRIPLEQLDVKVLSREKIRDLFRMGKLPSMDQIVEEILRRALEVSASDIHIEPIENELQIRFNHEGVLKRLVSLPPDMGENILSILKTRATLNQFEKKKPQEGRFSTSFNNEQFDFRLNIVPVMAGERALVRVLRKSGSVGSLDDLGFEHSTVERLKMILRSPRGLFLVSGPASSGKSLTLYTVVNRIQTPEKCIVSVEDPVEFRLPFASQIHLPPDKSFTYGEAMKALLRQNPDVIMLGEIRDVDTGVVAAEAAVSGVLVMGTILAEDAIGAIERLIHLGVPSYLVASTMIGSVYQLLVRRVCQQCKEEYVPEAGELQYLGLKPQGEVRFVRGKGCPACGNTGYRGRIAIGELVSVTPELREMIATQASTHQLRMEAAKHGYAPVRADAVKKVQAGITSSMEVMRVLG